MAPQGNSASDRVPFSSHTARRSLRSLFAKKDGLVPKTIDSASHLRDCEINNLNGLSAACLSICENSSAIINSTLVFVLRFGYCTEPIKGITTGKEGLRRTAGGNHNASVLLDSAFISEFLLNFSMKFNLEFFSEVKCETTQAVWFIVSARAQASSALPQKNFKMTLFRAHHSCCIAMETAGALVRRRFVT